MPNKPPPLESAIQTHFPDALKLLEELVGIGSYSLDPEGVNQTGNVLARQFGTLGFSAKQVQSEDARCGKHLLLNKPGSGNLSLLLVGHLDTVYPNDELVRHNFHWQEDGDRIYGPGTVDIKGGNVMIWLVLAALQETDPAFFESVHWQVHFDAAEELLGDDFAKVSYQNVHPGTRAALVFEYAPTNGREWKILTGRKGRAQFRIQVDGKAAHAGHPELGANAIRQLSELVPQIEALTDPRKGLTANVGTIRGGEASNSVPHFAEASAEVRASKKDVLDEAVGVIQSLKGEGNVKCITDGMPCRIHVELEENTDAWDPDNPASQELLKTWQTAGKELGLQIDSYERGGLSDGNYLAALGLPTLDGLGPDGGNLHSSHNEPEFVRVDTFARKALLNALAIQRLGS